MLQEIESNSVYVPEINDYADLMLEYLHQLGVEYIFGVPGGAIEPLYNAMARSERRGGIKTIVARHECAAAYMAEGYYRETGKLGVVCSTTGPGATNLITGVASASVEHSPMLVITAQTALPKFGKKPLQDSSETAIDTVSIFKSCTKYNAFVSHTAQLEGKLISALIEAFQPPCGPVHISIPADILRAPYQDARPNVHVDYLMKRSALEDRSAVELLFEEVLAAENIALVVGHGCGRAYGQIEELAEVLNAAFVSGPMGKTWVNEHHPLYRGVLGYAGHASADELINDPNTELVIALGTSMTEMGVGSVVAQIEDKKIIHMDSSVEHFSRSPNAKLHVFGHLDVVLNRLLRRLKLCGKQKKRADTRTQANKNVQGGYASLIQPHMCQSDETPIKPQRLIGHLSNNLPQGSRIFIDTGNIWAWATHYLHRSENNGLYRVSMGCGSMAWAISAVIGSAIASPQEPHVCLAGDGAWLMSSHEIGVAVQHKLPVLFVILNDTSFGMIRFGQQLSQAESIGWKLNEVDFAMLAKAQGANGIIINSPEQLVALDLEAIFKDDKPTLLDVRIDKDEMPPMMARVKSLNEGKPEAKGYS